MAKLYVFGVGGTGSRVIKSLSMLLAAGVKTNYDIVPIIIDPDRSGGDKNRTVKLLKEYQMIHQAADGEDYCSFFKNKITTLSDIINSKGGDSSVIDGFSYEIKGAQNDRFKDFIDYNTLDENNKLLASLLFSESNLNADLDVGFKGNPNMGSVVLNQFSTSEAFQAFADSYEKDDRIFIISSIFGGTGAAGFPLLLKNIRSGFVNGKFYSHLENAVIGAIAVLPYFKVKSDDDSEIDSHGFITKTKAALRYYSKNVTGNDTINALYYAGDLVDNQYDNVEGGTNQQNDAHFIELISALSIVDFASIDKNYIKTSNGKAVRPTYKEFGISQDGSQITFNHLSNETKSIIQKSLTEFFYFNMFMKEALEDELDHPYASAYSNKFDKNFLNQTFFKTLSKFQDAFRIWLAEMSNNKVGFAPFDFQVMVSNNEINGYSISSKSIFSVVRNVPEKKSGINIFAKNNYELFISELNKAAEDVGDKPVDTRLLSVFSKASEDVVSKKLF